MAHVVTAALVSVKDPAGKNTYFYEGATVPDGFNAADIERLVEAGLIEEKAEPKPAASRPAK